jgi:UDP-glucose 4-epimerase
VLVTGGAGFIGSHLVEALLARGDRVVVVDDLSTGRRSNLPQSHPGLTTLIARVSDAVGAPDLRRNFDTIYHLAAAVGVQRVIDDPIRSIENNVTETADILRFALAHGPHPGTPARLLFASSSEVYGKSTATPFHEHADTVFGPTSARRWSYGASKALGEHLVLAHAERHALPATIVRLFNTVGPRQVGHYGMVLPRFVAGALRREPLRVFGDGTQSRCFCDVRDVVPAIIGLADHPGAIGGVFNVGSDIPIAIADLARAVNRLLDSPAGIRLVPYDQAYGPGFEDLPQRIPSLTRVRSVIGFQPVIGLADTVRDIAAELRAPTPAALSASTEPESR